MADLYRFIRTYEFNKGITFVLFYLFLCNIIINTVLMIS